MDFNNGFNISNFINSGLTSILDNIQDVIWSVDFNNGANNYVNASVSNILGISLDEFRKNFKGWKNFIHEEDIDEFNKYSNRILRGETDRVELQYRIISATNETRWVNSRVWCFRDDNGKVTRLDGIVTDITAQKIAENQIRETNKLYQNIVETSSEGIVLINKSNKIIFANKKMAQLLDYNVVELISQPISKFMNSDNYRKVIMYLNSFNNNFSSSEETFKINNFFHNEFKLQKKDGSDIWVMISAVPVTDENNLLTGFLGMVLDVTPRKKMEIELAKAKIEADSANKIKSQFLANMSHEIRTPINSIVGFTDMLYDTHLDYAQREMLHYIKTSGKSLISIINDILDFSKIESGKLEIENIEFDIIQTVYEVFSICNVNAINKKIKLIYSVDSDINYKVIGDPNRLRQVLINLVSNAVKFAAQGVVALNVKLKDEFPDRVNIEFHVKDEGIGIDPAKLDKIFEPFMQADGGITRRYGGIGLGLPISNHLVQIMGGDNIKVESKPGMGSIFSFELPFLRGSAHSDDVPAAESASLFSDKKSSYRILVVEDNDTNRVLAEKVLKQYGHNVISVTNGELAVESVKSIQFDLVLMDVQMPVMDGIEATYCIRKLGSAIPIIALTANAQKTDVQCCIDAGMDGYISKPIIIAELNKVITDIVERKKKQDVFANKNGAASNNNSNAKKGFYNSSELNNDMNNNLNENSYENFETFDYERLNKNLGGIKELMVEAVSSYIQYFPDYITDLKSAVSAKNNENIRLYAHKLKGTALNACAVKSSELLYSIEKSAKNGNLEEIDRVVKNVVNEFESYKKAAAILFN